MLSAHPDSKKEAAMAGADFFIAKPFDMDELLALVKRAIQSKVKNQT
jgi:DNA-binding response OmpR family regulator